MPNLLFISSGAAGMVLFLSGLCFKILKTGGNLPAKALKSKTTGFLEKITSGAMLHKFLDWLAEEKTIPANKLFRKLLETGEAGITLQQIYFLKLVCLLTSVGLVLILGYTNMTYEEKAIIETSRTASVYSGLQSGTEKSGYLLYRQVEEGLNKSGGFDTAGYAEKYTRVEAELSERLNMTDERALNEYTGWFLKTYDKVSKLHLIDLSHILIMISAFFLPELVLAMRWLIRGCVYKREIIKLEYIFELLARVDGIKTLDIIRQLEKSSKIYSKYLDEFAQVFIYDKKRAFEYLKGSNIKGLKQLAKVLEVYSLADKNIALQILEREVMERDEAIMITADETVDFVDLIAFLSIVPLVYELVRLMLNPMLNMVYRAFEFI